MEPLTQAQAVDLLRELDELQLRAETLAVDVDSIRMEIRLAQIRVLEQHALTCPIDNTTPDMKIYHEVGHA